MSEDEEGTFLLVKNSIEREYQAVLDRCARLLSFASALPDNIDADVDLEERQVALALDDLISLALHARRLITDAKFETEAKSVNIEAIECYANESEIIFVKRGKTASVWKILNIIIHNEHFEIYRKHWDFTQYSPQISDDVYERYQLVIKQAKTTFLPKLAIKSDQSDAYLIELKEFLHIFTKDIFVPLINKCEENGIYLSKAFSN